VLKMVNLLTKVGMLMVWVCYLLKKLRDTGTRARQPGTGRRQRARTVENVDTESVNDLVLSHNKGALNKLKCIEPHVKCKGDQHSSPASVQHYSSGSSIKMSEETARA